MSKRRVVVTGLGVLAPNGNSVGDYWNSISNGISGIKEISSFDASGLSVRIAGELDGFDPNEHFDRKELKNLIFLLFTTSCHPERPLNNLVLKNIILTMTELE